MHREEAATIHPDILSSRIVSEEGEVVYKDLAFSTTIQFEREWKLGGKPWKSTWEYTQSPPEKFRVELVAGEEPFALGSYWENTYREVSGGTLISTEGEIVLRRLKAPRVLQGWLIRRGLSRSDEEDLAFLRKADLSHLSYQPQTSAR